MKKNRTWNTRDSNPKRYHGDLTNIDRDYSMLTMHRNGMSYFEIGNVYGLSRQRVGAIVRRMTKNELNKF